MAKRKGIKLSFDADDYVPITLKYEYSYQELHDEYRRLYKLAKNRMHRLSSAGFSGSNIYQYAEATFKGVSNYPNTGAGKHALAHALSDVAAFVQDPLTTVSGQKELWKRTTTTLQSRGYDVSVDELESYGKFWQFMRSVMDREQLKTLDSDRVYKLWKANQRLAVPKGVLRERYAEYLSNAEALEELPKYTRASGMSRTEYWNSLEF